MDSLDSSAGKSPNSELLSIAWKRKQPVLVFYTRPISCIAALPQHQFHLQFQIFLPVSHCHAGFELKIWKGFLALLPALFSRKDEHLEILLTITINILGKTSEVIERYLHPLIQHFYRVSQRNFSTLE